MWEIPKPPILLVADFGLAGDRLLHIVDESFRAGCKWVLVRAKFFPSGVLLELTRDVMRLSKKWDAVVFVSGSFEVAVKTGARGVHLPWGGNPETIKEKKKSGIVVGMSTHSLREAVYAEKHRADYVTFSPIYPSISKPDYGKSAGVEELKKVASQLRIPVVALGGIEPKKARPCLLNGAKAVAVMGAVLNVENPFETMAQLVAEVENRDSSVEEYT